MIRDKWLVLGLYGVINACVPAGNLLLATQQPAFNAY